MHGTMNIKFIMNPSGVKSAYLNPEVGAKNCTAVEKVSSDDHEERNEESQQCTGRRRCTCKSKMHKLKLKLNSVALVRERTIPTERPPPVGEVSANFCG